ncbi:MAG TPA: hypothetical protein VMV05_03075, partial [bacterium]|nr:hypothetical protein [bacterium]
EAWELTSSYYYWKTGDVWTPCNNSAPGALCALPLLTMDLKTHLAHEPNYMRPTRFLFMDNLNRLQSITAWSRGVQWLLGLLIGFLLFWTVQERPLVQGVAVLVLWGFEPNLLAYSGIAKSDIAVTFWFFLYVLNYRRAQATSRNSTFALAGLLAGLTASARYSGILILPVLGVLELAEGGMRGPGWSRLKGRIPGLALFTAFFLGAILACYLPGTLFFPGHPLPFLFYAHSITDYLHQQPAVTRLSLFFAGKFWENGSYLNFPYHFFFKNTVPFFLLVCLGLGLGLTRKISLPAWVWVPPAIYLGFFYLLVKSMTIRHALPAYPFLIWIAGAAFEWLWKESRKSQTRIVRYFPALLLAWHPVSVLCNFPNHIAYANDFMTTGQKAACLNSFEWDLGQDMKRLAELGGQRGWKKAKLMSYQRTDPYFYGLPWEPWTARDLAQPQPGFVYVLDPDITRGDSYYSGLFSKSPWVGRLPATGNVGGTLYYYEIPGDPSLSPPDRSEIINSFPYYPNGVPPYHPGGWARGL